MTSLLSRTAIAAVFGLGLLCSTASAQVFIDDAFGDGSLSSNSTGIGGGFASIGQGAVTEAGGFVSLNSIGNNSSTFVIRSNASFNPFDATTPTVLEVAFGYVPNGSQLRGVVGYRASSNSSDHFLPGTQGLYVGVNYSSDGSPTRGFLSLTNAFSSTITLATWNWVDFNDLSGMTLTLTTTAYTYELAFSGAGGATPNFVSGSATGALPVIGFHDGQFSFLAHAQRLDGNTGTTLLQIDSVRVSAIPEPAAFATLAALGTLGLAVTRRRARSA